MKWWQAALVLLLGVLAGFVGAAVGFITFMEWYVKSLFRW